ncbi:MAG: DUF4922 domain-containing protein, partial [Muribaculaceae bacterium]|nr:DUF4922 domain-containing protein [Muribaculaceae bacterium]
MKEVIFYDMEEIQSFVDRQLNSWNLASQNYKDLYGVKRRSVSIGDFEATIQCNPARIISTAAKVNDGMPISRPCFLCKKNRPSSQFEKVIFPGWEMLVNPYPIFPVHLTIVNSEHIPQSRMPEAIVDIADCLPGMAVFFNGARAGASAPDHLHLQAVMKDELPIVKIAETYHSDSDLSIRPSSDFNLDLPFLFYSGVVRKEFKDSQIIRTALSLGGLSEDGTLTDPTLVNSFFWKDNTGALR